MNKLLSIIVVSTIYAQNSDLSQDWIVNENFQLSSQLETVIQSEIATLPNILGMIVIYKGEIVSENYYNSSSQEDVYNVWSVTKSYTSTLIGQAVDMGMMQDPDSLASDFFPDYDIDYLDEISLHHLLSMSSGFVDAFYYPSWYVQSTENLLSMSHGSPGYFFYNNSACHLNSHALFYATGLTPHEFASIHLFPYLGIENPEWSSGYQGINDGSASLFLSLRDMTKLGQLYLQGGYSGEVQILSEAWIDRATTPQVNTNWGNSGYGYLWWLPEVGTNYMANGFGGQYIAVIPEYDLVIGTHSTDWGPGDINVYTNDLSNAIFGAVVPVFDIPTIVVNEILASNSQCCTDEYGENDPYIELYNYGTDTVDVGGYILINDDYENEIPSGSESTMIAPNEFLILWLDSDMEQGDLHLDGILNNTGGEISLIESESNNLIDYVDYPISAPDLAYARENDGSSNWIYTNPTPGQSNTTEMDLFEEKIIPTNFKLLQNYPNPFNPSTSIIYDLKEVSDVKVSIYNMLGQKIITLVDNKEQAGSKSVIWDGQNESGMAVPSGVYVYEIRANSYVQSKKMILMK